MSGDKPIDQEKTAAFAERAVRDLSGMMTTLMCVIGDRLGLFKTLENHGPATSAEFADRASLSERYAREWLGAMASAGYLEFDPPSRRYALPPEHSPVLAHEGGPMFFGGTYQEIPGLLKVFDEVVDCFREGGGVPQSSYSDDWWNGMRRFTSTWFENLLVQEWLPAVPEVQAKLESGVSVADVGCGSGMALIKLAQAFPKSRYVGYDVFEPSVAEASANAEAAGVEGQVRFQQLDVSQRLPEQHDLITTFDVVHDMADPLGALRTIRQALRPDGRYLMLEMNSSDKHEENVGPIATLLYGYSVMYCMTTSLANGGEGLGTLGLPESKVRELCTEAGFSSVRRLPIENPFNSLYEIGP